VARLVCAAHKLNDCGHEVTLIPVATREAIQRWQSVLLEIEQYHALPSGQRTHAKLGTPQARTNWTTVNTTPVYGIVRGTLTTLVTDLWSVDAPTDPALVNVLQPVINAAIGFTPWKELLPQWDDYVAVVQAARQALDTEPMGEPTVDEIIAEMMLSLKTTLLIAGTGNLGAMTLIASEITRRYVNFAAPFRAPERAYDLATNRMVDLPSTTTLSLAAIKTILNPVREKTDSNTSQPPVMKQFAAQAIVDFYTDWEEYYRAELARAHQCSKRDFQIDYFGDLNRMRQDYVHNRGVCSNSAHCTQLTWFSEGDLMIPTPENYLQLLTDLPADELRQRPVPRQTGRERISIRASTPLIRRFEEIAGARYASKGDSLDEALRDWITTHDSAD